MLIYTCSSSHGFGHAARDAAVLQALRRLRPEWTLVMSSGLPPPVLKRLLGDSSIQQRSCHWDVGMVQADALGVDRAATLTALDLLEQRLPALIEAEASWLAAQEQPVLIFGDIPPAAAALAQRVRAPLVWMSNFGWDDIYAPLGPAFQRAAEAAAEAYRCGDLLLRCPFDLPMNWGLPERRLGLVCGTPQAIPADLEACFDALHVPVVLVGFGGIGLSLRSDLFQLWPNHHFLLPASATASQQPELAELPNLTVLPEGVRPVDVLGRCSRSLGKPGFSSFCEAMAQGVGLHVVERSGFAEASALMDGLQRHGQHRFLSRLELDAGAWQLDQPLLAPTEAPLSALGAQEAALALVSWVEGIFNFQP
ncbi:hypothetical protein [Synechococcus sp. MU1611]|uniref:hypothetical protein n=1 Tax=Synechococcus sp. MU1611 TaxID=2508345 RepID=UPI001CF8B757|nr:hypothetical protein [Synechococcus sp. MU1611]